MWSKNAKNARETPRNVVIKAFFKKIGEIPAFDSKIICIYDVMNTMGYSVHSSRDMSTPSRLYDDRGSSGVSFSYDQHGNRKYVTLRERKRFLRAAKNHASASVYTFCLVLSLTGARLSEVLALTPRQIDIDARCIVVRSLKKRRGVLDDPVFRPIPVPQLLLTALDDVHHIVTAQRDPARSAHRIWPWCRTTAWKRVKEVMHQAGITGVQASPKGLRHGFAVGALVAGVPDMTVMRWLGHARIETTLIYTEAVGVEARMIAKRMWAPLLPPDLLA